MLHQLRAKWPLAVVCLLVASIAWGQASAGSITGAVTDPTGAVVVGASVELTNVATNTRRVITTNEAGLYNLPQLQPGTYNLRVETAGFKAQERAGINLQVGQVARIDFTLEVGNVTEVVEVTGGAPLLQSETTEIGTVIENQRILDLPLNGRNYLQLASLIPGATTDGPSSSQGQQRMGGARNEFSMNVSGQRVHFNHYSLDGLENTDPNFNTYLFLPSLDALQEFKVESGLFQAEYGRAIAQINVSTRGGTNEFHGAFFEFLRNAELDAKNFFDNPNNPIPPFKRNQFGFMVGGPVIKNKLFFMGNYEGLRERRAVTNTSSMPRLSDRAGDFSGLRNSDGSLRQIFDPASRVIGPGPTGVNTVVSSTPFLNNMIPANRVNSTSATVLKEFYPTPNQGAADQISQNFLSNESARIDNDQYTVRVDWSQNDVSNWFFRFSESNELEYRPFVVPGQGNNVDTDPYQAVLANTRLFGTNMVNEIRGGVSRLSNGNIQTRANEDDVVSRLGIGGVANNPLFWGIPVFQINNYSTVGECNDCPFVNWDTVFQLKDDLSWTTGKHNLKIGTDLRRTRYNQIGAVVPRGRFTFNGQFTSSKETTTTTSGYSVADFLLGHISNSEGQVGAPIAAFRTHYIALYVQDTWKLTPKLTLNLGLRWEDEPPYYDKHDAIVNFDFRWDHSFQPIPVRLGEGDPNEGSQGFSWPAEVGYVRDGRFGRRAGVNDPNDFGPRIGLAYRVTDKTVIRTGAGIYYVRDIGNAVFDVVRNAPFTTRAAEPANNLVPNQTYARPFTRTATPSFLLINQHGERSSYVNQWTFGVQQQLTEHMSLEVTYLGSSGVKLRRLTSYNTPPPGPGDQSARRPFPIYGVFQNMNAPSHSSYHALQARLQHRFSKGLTVLSSFAWSKSIDNGSGIRTTDGDPLTPSNNYNLDAERGMSAFHFGRRWTTSWLYELPFGKNSSSAALRHIAGGWQIGGIFTLQDGFPATAACGSGSNAFQNGGGGCYPDVVASAGSVNLDRSAQTIDRFFNTEAFVDRLPGGEQFRYGNSARNTIIGPGIINWDASISKTFPISEPMRLEFRAEFFNAANHPIFGQPGPTLRSPNYGKLTSIRIDARTTQFGLKLYF